MPPAAGGRRTVEAPIYHLDKVVKAKQEDLEDFDGKSIDDFARRRATKVLDLSSGDLPENVIAISASGRDLAIGIPGTVLLLLRAAAPFVPVAGASDILFISLMAVITPSATTITQMAQIYDRGASYASSINVLTTLVCIATMPLMAFFYML